MTHINHWKKVGNFKDFELEDDLCPANLHYCISHHHCLPSDHFLTLSEDECLWLVVATDIVCMDIVGSLHSRLSLKNNTTLIVTHHVFVTVLGQITTQPVCVCGVCEVCVCV